MKFVVTLLQNTTIRYRYAVSSDYQLYNVPSGPQSHTRPLDQEPTSFVVSFAGSVAAAVVACCLLLKVRYE